jgi:hypothetical protein
MATGVPRDTHRPDEYVVAMDTLRATVELALGNQYDVIDLIGRGGMGTVYLARERFLERLVAVKVLPHETTGDGSGRERFLREARTAARLSHPSIVPLHTFSEAGGVLLYVMGYIAGESLEAKLKRDGRLDPAEATRITSEIADALHYAHSMGVVHRDVKPDNILLDGQSGRAYLTDFGIAKQGAQHSLTRTGMVVGTPHYMSPEQGSGDPDVDGRSDLYALGVIGYRMLSGRLPFDAPGFQELLMQHATRDPAPLDVHPGTAQLVPVITRCLRKQPAERWPNGAAIVEALRPREAHDFDIPDDLVGFPSSGFAMIVTVIFAEIALGFMHATAPGEMDVLPRVLVPVVVLPVWLGSYAMLARRHRRAWRDVARMAFWAPAKWNGWWPRDLRRPGDVWDRLPRAVRTVRTVFTAALTVMVGISTPMTIIGATWWGMGQVAKAQRLQRISLPVGGLAFAAFMAGIVMTLPWRKRFGISNALAKRLLSEPSWKNPFWKRPEIASLLTPIQDSARTPAAETPAELVAAIQRAAAALPDPLAAVGVQAAAAAREVLVFIHDADREMTALAREADPVERAQLERKLAAFHTPAGGAAPRSQMRELVEQQLALVTQLEGRRRQLGDDRARSVAMLRRLVLQLATARTQLARDDSAVSELSGQLRAIYADLERGQSAVRDVERMLAPTVTGPG